MDMQATSVPFFSNASITLVIHRDEPISEQARIALPVCVAH
jgi:hypothetical protein